MGMDVGSPRFGRRARWEWSASHWLHLLFGVAVIYFYVLGGIAQTHVGRLPAEFPVEDLSWPATIGEYTVSSEAELVARAASQPVGYPVRVRGAEGGIDRYVTVERAHTYFHNLVTRLNGLFFLAVTLVVFAPRVDIVPARDLFWACLLYGLAVMIGGIYAPTVNRWWSLLLPALRIVSLVILPTLMLHIGMSFPRRTRFLDRNTWFIPVVTVVGLLAAAWYYFTWLQWVNGDGAWADIRAPRQLHGLFLAAVFGSGCLGLVLGYRRTDAEREREQVKWVLWGITVGGAPFVFLHALPLAVDSDPMLTLSAARFFSLVIPLAFSAVVVRHRFLDVDIIIRRSLIYVLLASMMVGIYVVLGILVGRRVERAWPQFGPFVPIAATLVAVVLFSPTRKAIGVVIDRLFFKIRYDYAQALAAFQRELRGTTNQQQAADRLAGFLKKHLYPSEIAVVLSHDDRHYRSGNWPSQQPPQLQVRGEPVLTAVPGTTVRSRVEDGSFPRRLQAAGYVLAHEVVAEGQRIGMVALGAKRTGRLYVSEDLELLSAVTRETSICVQRMNLEQDFVSEVVARHQMEEMSRFRTQFFAQFAHDLRSPLTSINWGARNLLDGVVGDVTPAQARYLEGIEASARQLVRLVNNLLEVTRLESGMPEVELETVDLRGVVEESVSKLTAGATTREIGFSVQGDEAAPMTGNAEKLLEVMDNLIENAVRYSPPHGRVVITVESSEAGVRLSVEDEGPGVDANQAESIFEPYRQGTPSPHSSQGGFGLGLFVVRSWTERMGGTVKVEDRSIGGARFVLEFPTSNESGASE